MRVFWYLLVGLAGVASAAGEEGKLAGSAFFQALQGSWIGDGAFLSPDKPPQAVENRIEAAFGPHGDEFVIRGNLESDGTPLEYVWTYTVHEIEGLYRAVWKNLADPGSGLEYAVSIDEGSRTATLEPAVGTAGSSLIRFVQRVEGADRYVVELRITDAAGVPTLEGTVVFHRPGGEAPPDGPAGK
jgi:hypothetical protein